VHNDISQGCQTDSAGYHQIHKAQHFFGENDETEPGQTGPKWGKKFQENVPVEKFYQCYGRNKIEGQVEEFLSTNPRDIPNHHP